MVFMLESYLVNGPGQLGLMTFRSPMAELSGWRTRPAYERVRPHDSRIFRARLSAGAKNPKKSSFWRDAKTSTRNA